MHVQWRLGTAAPSHRSAATPPYWRQCLRELESPSERFINKEDTGKALADAQAAEQRGKLA